MYYLQQPSQEDEDKLPSLSVSCCVDTSGILDVKWARNFSSSVPLFGLVNASGECQLWKVSDRDENTVTTQNEASNHLADTLKDSDCLRKMLLPLKTEKIGDCLALSLDWTGPLESSSPKIVVSDSSGSLSVLEAGNDFRMTSHWHAHDYEAWICAFDMWNPEIVYSG
ncbi:hypothetical protein C0Q70_00871 [Pomacea canaliculata]|uniref:Uncharacterized protein n=2 Tax=Pomacea canaliculata TaxID=400727 RepID=A0A2T7PXY7_POMCA|nr:hypothetical protein C0Q70_00871 [Pomacea canaliculata]